jgi:anti-anti-sigma factor
MRHHTGRTCVQLLVVTGELDLFTTSRLAEHLARNPTIRILDLSNVSFIDAAGLRILIDAARVDPRLVIRAPSACIRRLCAIAGLQGIAETAATSGDPLQIGDVEASGRGASRPLRG